MELGRGYMLTRELVESLFDIKDGQFYHKPKLEVDARTKEWNKRYAGKKAGYMYGGSSYRVSINNKGYKASDILDMLETGVFCVKTREKYRFESLKYSKNTDVVGYQQWCGIISRLNNSKLYTNVSISDDFLDFDNYLEWAKEQIGFNAYDDNGLLYHIDKDLLSEPDNLMYSKDTCLFIPQEINTMCKLSRNSNLKKGVQFLKGRKKPYRAYININGKPIGLGYYYTEEEANAQYKIARHNRIDDLYLKYKDKVDPRVWNALRSDIWCA